MSAAISQRISLLLLIPVLAAALACGTHEATEHYVEPTTIKARVATAEVASDGASVELYGTVEAEKTASISTRVMAMVTAVHVRAGDRVRKGQLLLEIDPQASEGQVAQARGALGQARAALALAERNYERFQALAESNAASELELDMARMQYEQALAAVEQADGAVSSASSVAGDSRVTAPFAGRVARKMVEVGDLAAPGRPLLSLESESGRRLVLSVPESLMQGSGLVAGTEIAVQVDARDDLGVLTGTVAEVDPGADPASHSFRVKVLLPEVDLASGSAGRARIQGPSRNRVYVPANAVLRRGGMQMVVVRDDEGRASSRVVTLGSPLGSDRIEVLSGLAGGETVLVDLDSIPPLGASVEAL